MPRSSPNSACTTRWPPARTAEICTGLVRPCVKRAAPPVNLLITINRRACGSHRNLSSVTDSTTSAISAHRAQVMSAIRTASAATGADFDYLVKTAQRESNFDPSAKAPTSSATGLFQFTEGTWMEVLERYGA